MATEYILFDTDLRERFEQAVAARALMEHLTAEEAHALVSAIAHSLENPVDGPFCRKS